MKKNDLIAYKENDRWIVARYVMPITIQVRHADGEYKEVNNEVNNVHVFKDPMNDPLISSQSIALFSIAEFFSKTRRRILRHPDPEQQMQMIAAMEAAIEKFNNDITPPRQPEEVSFKKTEGSQADGDVGFQ